MAHLHGEGSSYVQGSVVAIERDALLLEFTGPEAPVLPIGDRARLSLLGPRETVVIHAQVIFGRDDPAGHQYRFQVSRTEDVDFGALF